MMLSFICARRLAICFLLASTSLLFAQTNYYATNGGEYTVIGSLPGDQVFPDAAISSTGGFVVWQDNAIDGSGWGIGARRLDSTLSGTLSTFRVNQTTTGNQQNPRVALLKNGGAVFVWQGGSSGFQHIYAKFLTSTNTFTSTNDILVNTFTNYYQISPAVAVLTNGNVVVLWGSLNEAGSGSAQDVYGQILSPTGTKLGGEFLVNQFTTYNQRSPAVAALPTGGFVAGWVSEQERVAIGSLGSNTVYTTAANSPIPSIDVYARIFNTNGTAASSEFLVNTDLNTCADPAIATASDGSYMVTWCENNFLNTSNSWDIYARPFVNTNGGAMGVINTHVYGDQYAPRISAIGLDYIITWTSLGQDGSREGVYGQYVHDNGAFVGTEFRFNSTIAGSQMQPTVASDGLTQFLAVWTGFTPTNTPNFDLYAQRYANVTSILQAMSAPFVWAPFVMSNAVYQPQLVVTWPVLQGLSVSNFEVYVDGASTPTGLVASNQWTMSSANGLTTNATHSFALDYVLVDGRRSPLSPATSGTTWSGQNWHGIPIEWIEQYYGLNFTSWPTNVNAPLAPGGPSLWQLFISGGDPLDPSTWLKMQLSHTAQGLYLVWNTQPGATYQVQVTSNFNSWSNVGSSRFAAGTSDSIYIGGSSVGYYRVVLLRQ